MNKIEILERLDDRGLLTQCINYRDNTISLCPESFWKDRFELNFGDLEIAGHTWKEKYLNVLIATDIEPFINKLNEKISGPYGSEFYAIDPRKNYENRQDQAEMWMRWEIITIGLKNCRDAMYEHIYSRTVPRYEKSNINKQKSNINKQKSKRASRLIAWIKEINQTEDLFFGGEKELYNILRDNLMACKRGFGEFHNFGNFRKLPPIE